MPQENVELVRQGYEAFNAGGLDAIVQLLDPNIEWGTPEQAMEGGYSGHEGVRRFWSDFTDVFERYRFEPEDFIAVGDRVVVPFRFIATAKATGVEAEERWVNIWTIRDGKAVRLEQYTDVPTGFAAAGLSEQDAHANS
jgi:ketosteroid isomerase-like protein